VKDIVQNKPNRRLEVQSPLFDNSSKVHYMIYKAKESSIGLYSITTE
jgi:hypothetical protein